MTVSIGIKSGKGGHPAVWGHLTCRKESLLRIQNQSFPDSPLPPHILSNTVNEMYHALTL